MGLRIGDEPVPNYRLVRFLGRGGFGQVWAATSPGGIHVALKIIDLGGREGVKEFKALRLMKSIRQANLTPILAFWLKDEDGQLVDESQVGNDLSSNAQPQNVQGTVLINSLSKMRPDELIIAMGLGDKTLSDRLRECNEQGLAGIPPDELFNYMIDAARAIDFLNTPRHDLGHGPISPIQHCDIKPQNILIVGDTAQVCDFGLARELGTNVKMTSAAVSPAYGAPELIEGRPPSGATDQYSLAITYVELRTGGLPFADPDSYLHVVNAHLYGGLDLNGLSAAEQEVIRKATSRDPADRFESALKMVKALRQACPDDAGSIRVMPTQSRQGTSSQVGSGLNVTAPLPIAGTGHSIMPVPLMPHTSSGLTETPGARVGVTKVDSRLAATTHLTEAVESESQRTQNRRGRIWKTAAAVAVLGVALGAVYYNRYVNGPVYQAAYAALSDIDNGRDEKDLFKRTGHYFDAYQNCEPFATDPRISDTVTKAQDLLKNTAQEVQKEAESVVGESAPDDPGRQRMLDGLVIYDRFLDAYLAAPGFSRLVGLRENLRRTAAEAFVSHGEGLLRHANGDAATLSKANESFEKADKLISNKKDKWAFLAKLGMSRVEASQKDPKALSGSGKVLDGLLRELRARGVYAPLWQAQIRVLLALEAKQANEQDPKPMLKELAELQDSDLDLFNDPTIGGDEAVHVKSMLDWALGFGPLPDDIKRLAETGSQQSLNDAREKLPAAQEDQDPAAQQKALQVLRESARRGIESNDSTTKVGFEELLNLADVLDPQSVESDVSRSLEWFKSQPTIQLARLPQLTDALVKLAKDKPAQLELIVAALETHASDPTVRHSLPVHYKHLVERLVKEPTEADNYFTKLAAACERLCKLGGDDRLSSLALAESLHVLHAEEASAEQHQRIRDLLSTAEKQTAVPAQDMYEKFVKLLVGVDSKTMSDADRSQLLEIMKYAIQGTPGFAFAVNARRGELANLAVSAAASVRSGADGTLSIAAIMQPYGDGGAGPNKAYEFLEGAKSLAPGIGEDARYQANWLLVVWHKNETGRQIVTDRHQAELLKLVHNPAITEHERLPLLYVRVHLPLKADDLADRADAMDGMSTLFEALNRAETITFGDSTIEELATIAARWIEQTQPPLPTDEAFRKQLARLAYNLARLQKRHAIEESAEDQVAWHKLFSLATKLEDNNESYLAARGFSALEIDPPLTDEAFDDALKLEKLAPKSAETKGLMAFVKLAQSRREKDAAKREQLAAEAVKSGEDATLAKTDKEYLATYLVHLGDSYVALANYGPKESNVQAEHLTSAIDRIKKALQLNLRVFVYRDFAYVVLGNAHEDLAWLAQVGSDEEISKNYDQAIAAFKKVAEKNVPLGNMNLGRCYYKREVEGHQKGYLADAKAALEIAIARRKDYPEAYRWLGAVYEAEGNYDLAAEHFDKAVRFAKEQGSYNHGLYECYWARAILETKKQPASIRAEILNRLNDVDAQDEKVHKDLLLAVGKTYENEGKWQEAIKQYSTAIGDSPKLIDADLLRRRAGAWYQVVAAKIPKKEDVLSECRSCANDSNLVVALDKENASWSDLYFQARANELYWGMSRGKANDFQVGLERSINAYDAALAKIEKLPKRAVVDWGVVEDVFDKYFELLLNPNFKDDFPRMGAPGRTTARAAADRMSKSAGRVSSDFQNRLIKEKLNKSFRQELLSLKDPGNPK